MGISKKKKEEGKDEERCTSTCYVTLVMDDLIDIYDYVYVTEAVVVVHPLMLQIDVTHGVVASVWDKKNTTNDTASSCHPETESLGSSARVGLRSE